MGIKMIALVTPNYYFNCINKSFLRLATRIKIYLATSYMFICNKKKERDIRY